MSVKFPTLKVKFKNDLELIEIILKLYSVGCKISLRPFELTVMKYYIKYGFTEEAFQYIKEDENKKDGDIKVANVHLRDKGFLLHGVNNERKSTLSKDMEELRRQFINDKKSLYVFSFERR